MLPRQFRLNPRSQADFFVTARSGRSSVGKWFWLPADSFQTTVIVGKTTYPQATDRNRLKRRWRQALAQVIRQTSTDHLPALQIAFVPNRQTMTWPMPELVQQLQAALNRVQATSKL